MKPPDVKPEWRTETVTGLCQAMREAQDYSAAPILADALEEAGFPETETLDALRRPEFPRWRLELIIASVYSEQTAAAVAWLSRYTVVLGEGGYPGDLPAMTYEMLVEAARRYAQTGDDGLDRGSMSWSNATVDEEYQQFWSNWALVTGARPPEDDNRFLACRC